MSISNRLAILMAPFFLIGLASYPSHTWGSIAPAGGSVSQQTMMDAASRAAERQGVQNTTPSPGYNSDRGAEAAKAAIQGYSNRVEGVQRANERQSELRTNIIRGM